MLNISQKHVKHIVLPSDYPSGQDVHLVRSSHVAQVSPQAEHVSIIVARASGPYYGPFLTFSRKNPSLQIQDPSIKSEFSAQTLHYDGPASHYSQLNPHSLQELDSMSI